MKRTLRHTDPWQKKRSELPVNGNAEADWLQIRAILDTRMPVTAVIKKPFRFKMPKWGLHVFVGIAAAATLYTGARLYLSGRHHDLAIPNTQPIHFKSSPPAGKDSLSTPNATKLVPLSGTTAVTPVIPKATALTVNQAKSNEGTATKREQLIIDSIKAAGNLNVPMRGDSIILPANVMRQTPVPDSVRRKELDKKDLQKDTSNYIKKTPKKKKRSKLNVFL